MNAADVLETCKQSVARAAGFFSLLSERAPPPQPPEPPTQRLTREQLLPATPSVYLEHKKDAFSPQLQEFCLKHPIAVVRGIAAALKLGKLHFFSLLLCIIFCPAAVVTSSLFLNCFNNSI